MYEKEVAAGAGWLDVISPGWEYNIDLSCLDLADGCHCILGQSFNMNWSMITDFITKIGLSNPQQWLLDHGFATGHPHPYRFNYIALDTDWDDLEHQWTNLIKERFDEGALSDVMM